MEKVTAKGEEFENLSSPMSASSYWLGIKACPAELKAFSKTSAQCHQLTPVNWWGFRKGSRRGFVQNTSDHRRTPRDILPFKY
jgi:hypothetical protein